METVVRTIIGYLWIKSCWNKSSWSMSSFSAIPHPGDKSNNFCFVCSSNEFGASVFRGPYGDGYFSDVIWRLMDLWELGKKVLSFRICKRLPLMKHVFVSLFSFFFLHENNCIYHNWTLQIKRCRKLSIDPSVPLRRSYFSFKTS